ncbi:MAG: hypothetical protein KGL42_11875 [Betaproteobacteria bacterium]|nr:hypothetical protein [Betaproteobacteria bacterium]
MAKILMVGKGGFGDLFPLFALAKELQVRCHEIRIAAESHHASACSALQIPLTPLDHAAHALPSHASTLRDSLWRLLPLDPAMRATLDPGHAEYEINALLPHMRDVDLVIGNQLAYSGVLASRVLDRPWIFCAASPLAIPSAHDAPLWPYLQRMQRRTTRWGLPQRAYLPIARWATRALMQPQVRLRRRLGLADQGHPRFEGMYSQHLNLLMTSPVLAPAQPDWPRNTVVTGFPWFDPAFLGGDDQEQEIVQFAQAGAPPVVFAPGGSKRTDPGTFFERSVEAARLSGRRSIIVAAKKFHSQFTPRPDMLVTGYFPYARLFHLASVVVHSGGIGALGWAMRYGVPSLLVPSDWDQFDNARRAEQSGVGTVLDITNYTAATIAHRLDAIAADTAMHNNLSRMAPCLALEDGSRVASDAVEQVLTGLCRPQAQ